ncbi:MAG: sigma-70 family RNA polymerase sigma factor [candidate division Zixibacteria bacterium]|nr:sigma-70 family RNA polymerase sigma factor [candidate division Zixibacteria bacterium]
MNSGAESSQIAAQKDMRLFERIRQRDQRALAEMYDHRSGLVYSLAFSIVGNVSDAEEVTQEVFFKVWKNSKLFDAAKGSALAWLVTMTRRQAIDRTRSKGYKSQSRNVELSVQVDEAVSSRDYSNPTDEMLLRLQSGEVKSALANLNEKHLEVINLSYYQSMSHSEIAAQLESPLGTVKSRLREAVNHLRNSLNAKVGTND